MIFRGQDDTSKITNEIKRCGGSSDSSMSLSLGNNLVFGYLSDDDNDDAMEQDGDYGAEDDDEDNNDEDDGNDDDDEYNDLEQDGDDGVAEDDDDDNNDEDDDNNNGSDEMMGIQPFPPNDRIGNSIDPPLLDRASDTVDADDNDNNEMMDIQPLPPNDEIGTSIEPPHLDRVSDTIDAADNVEMMYSCFQSEMNTASAIGDIDTALSLITSRINRERESVSLQDSASTAILDEVNSHILRAQKAVHKWMSSFSGDAAVGETTTLLE